MTIPLFKARRYTLADGRIPNRNAYALYKVENGVRYIGVGGMRILKNTVIAYAGLTGLVIKNQKQIEQYADHFIYADTPKEALEKIKPYLH